MSRKNRRQARDYEPVDEDANEVFYNSLEEDEKYEEPVEPMVSKRVKKFSPQVKPKTYWEIFDEAKSVLLKDGIRIYDNSLKTFDQTKIAIAKNSFLSSLEKTLSDDFKIAKEDFELISHKINNDIHYSEEMLRRGSKNFGVKISKFFDKINKGMKNG